MLRYVTMDQVATIFSLTKILPSLFFIESINSFEFNFLISEALNDK
nr:hypothetical protein [Entomoplasma sp. MP1]